ncbi:MAG: MMPL family transporter [Nocardioides sp.]
MNSVQIDQTDQGPSTSAPNPPDRDSGAFGRLGRFTARRKWTVLAAYVLLLALCGALGSQVFTALGAAGYDDPGSESARAFEFAEDNFGLTDPALAIVVEVPESADAAADSAAATALVERIADEPEASDVVSYWTSGQPPALLSEDGRSGQVIVYAEGLDESEVMEFADRVTEEYGGTQGDDLEVFVGGFGAVSNSITTNVTEDLTRAESIAIPITVVLLIVVFGSVVSALLPFSVAGGAIMGSFLVLYVVTLFTDVSIFALNLVTGLGLGLGIDYALLIVNRYREELSRGLSPARAVERTVATAGRTVVVSGITVALVLGSLLLFPQYFLKSFAYSGIAVTLLAVITSVTALPALLAILGTRVDKLKVRRGDLAPKDHGLWSRVARFVMARPWPVLLVTVAALGLLAFPAASVSFTQTDARVLPADDPAARASEVLGDRFGGRESTPIEIMLPGGADETTAVAAYAAELSRLDDVVRVYTPESVVADGAVVSPNPEGGSYVAGDDARVRVISAVDALTSGARDQVEEIRALDAPVDGSLVGGTGPQFADAQTAYAEQGRWAVLWVVIATLIILFLYTGSLLLPIKAVLLNLLSLGAALGSLVWIFQEGHLGWLVGDFTVTGGVDTSMAIMIAVVAFALSMDYEVFLLSRIKEEHDAGRETTEAVAFGLQRSGRIITAAALLLAIVFASFVSSGVTSIKQLGFGIAFAILLDATVVRGLLVPALMRIAGRWNWWAPAPLTAFQRRFGLSEA